MNVAYRRELRRNYMIVSSETGDENRYECRIMERNLIDGFLPFRIHRTDEQVFFYYEITSRQPLSRMLEFRAITGDEIRSIVISIARILEQTERYLLREEHILLDPEYIYVEPDSFRIFLCLVPGLCSDFPRAYGKLLEYILGKVDHQDRESVVLAYGLYQETRKENYGMEDLLRQLHQAGTKHEKQGKKQAEKDSETRGWPTPNEGMQEFAPERERLAAAEEKRLPKQTEAERADRAENNGRTARPSLWSRFLVWVHGRKKQQEETPVQLPWQEMFMEMPEYEKTEPVLRQRPPEAGLQSTPPQRIPPQSMSPQPPQQRILSQPIPQQRIPSQPILPSQPPQGETCAGTVLLADFSGGNQSRRLRALTPGEEDIVLAYYPFVIGKQENVTDYCLNRDTVSRLHVKIDQCGEDYLIMDLNSTNGTVVNGEMLENNEAKNLQIGDEIQIARYCYRFE